MTLIGELTDREKTIIHLMNIMMNPTLKNISLEKRAEGILFIVKVKNLPFSLPELKELSHVIEQEQNTVLQMAFGLLNKHPEIAEHLGDFKF